MDTKIRQDIINHFRPEYFRNVVANKPGIVGSVMRADKALKGFATAMPILIAMPILTVFAISNVSFLSFPTLIAAVTTSFAMSMIILARTPSVQKEAKRNIDRDIDNGQLVRRYNTEVLNTQQKKIDETRTQLQKTGALGGEFKSAAATVPATAEATPALQPKDHTV